MPNDLSTSFAGNTSIWAAHIPFQQDKLPQDGQDSFETKFAEESFDTAWLKKLGLLSISNQPKEVRHPPSLEEEKEETPLIGGENNNQKRARRSEDSDLTISDDERNTHRSQRFLFDTGHLENMRNGTATKLKEFQALKVTQSATETSLSVRPQLFLFNLSNLLASYFNRIWHG
jgi:hypothetical protein